MKQSTTNRNKKRFLDLQARNDDRSPKLIRCAILAMVTVVTAGLASASGPCSDSSTGDVVLVLDAVPHGMAQEQLQNMKTFAKSLVDETYTDTTLDLQGLATFAEDGTGADVMETLFSTDVAAIKVKIDSLTLPGLGSPYDGETETCKENMGLVGFFFSMRGNVENEPRCHGVYVKAGSDKFILGHTYCIDDEEAETSFVGLKGNKTFLLSTANPPVTKYTVFAKMTLPVGTTKDYMEQESEAGCGFATLVSETTFYDINLQSCFLLSYGRDSSTGEYPTLKSRKAWKIELSQETALTPCTEGWKIPKAYSDAGLPEGTSDERNMCFIAKENNFGVNCRMNDAGAPVFCRRKDQPERDDLAPLIGFTRPDAECNPQKKTFLIEFINPYMCEMYGYEDCPINLF